MMVVRLSGEIFGDAAVLSKFASQVVSAVENGYKVLIVHDGGALDKVLAEAKIEVVDHVGSDIMNPKAMPVIIRVIEGKNDDIAAAIKSGLDECDGKIVQSGITIGAPIVYGKATGKYNAGLNGDLDYVDRAVLSNVISRASVIVISNLARFESTNDFGFVAIDPDKIALSVAKAMEGSFNVIPTKPRLSDLISG